jgi:hypothetical protein
MLSTAFILLCLAFNVLILADTLLGDEDEE